MNNYTIELSKLSWKMLLKPRTIILIVLLAAFGYWFFAMRPYLHVERARLAAPFLEIRSDQSGRLTFAPYQEGDWIKQGDILFSLSSFEEKQRQKQQQASVETFQKKLSYYLAGVENATEDYISARRDVELGAGSEDNVEQSLAVLQQQQQMANECKEQLAAAESSLEQSNQLAQQRSIAAPFSGVIVKRQKREGDLLSFGDSVYSFCDPNQVWVEAVIEEKFIGKISVGQKAVISLPTDKSRHWDGAIAWISPVALPLKEGIEVRISLEKKRWGFVASQSQCRRKN